MGYIIMHSACIQCGRPFGYNPIAVPSVYVNGIREPICRACIEAANPRRVARGLDPIVIRPDAYEPLDETELPDDD